MAVLPEASGGEVSSISSSMTWEIMERVASTLCLRGGGMAMVVRMIMTFFFFRSGEVVVVVNWCVRGWCDASRCSAKDGKFKIGIVLKQVPMRIPMAMDL